MTLVDLTPLVLTYNEALNIGRCLERLRWARRVVVLDSTSSDETARLVADFPNAELHERRFDNHTAQWNYGLGLVETEWVLSMDADYLLPAEFAEEIRGLSPPGAISAYQARFSYWVFGKPLRSTLYPPRAVLFRRRRCRYEPDGHTQKLRVEGKTGSLRAVIAHDDRKPLSHWLASQDAYAKLEAAKMLETGPMHHRIQDRLRRGILFAPWATLFYCLFVKGLILDGWRGWYYTFQRVLAEIMLSLRLLEARLVAQKPPGRSP